MSEPTPTRRPLRRRPQNGRKPAAKLEMGLLGDLIGYHLRCAHAAYFSTFNAAFAAHDITGPQFGTMLLVETNPGLTQSAVAEALRFDRSTLVQIIDRLEARGLVRRGASKSDRRSYSLVLTPEGHALLADLKRISEVHERDFAHALNARERQSLVRLLSRLHSSRT